MKTCTLTATVDGYDLTVKVPVEILTASEIKNRKVEIKRNNGTGASIIFQVTEN